VAPAPRRGLPGPGRLARLWPRVRPLWPELLAATIALLLSSAAGLAFPLVVRELLDAAFQYHDRALLDRIALGLVGLFTAQAALNFLQAFLLSAAGERAVAGLRQELFEKLLSMPPGFFADRKTGELTSRITTDVGLLQGVLSNQLAEFARQILALVGGVALLTWMQPRLTLTILAVTPVVIGIAFFFGKRLKRITTTVQDRVADASAVAEEAISQIRTVQSFVREHTEESRFGERIHASVQAALLRARERGIFFGALTFATFMGILIVLWQGGILVLQGQLTGGALVSFLLYTVTIAAAVGALATFYGSYQEAVGAAERVFELLETPSPIADPAEPKELARPVRGAVGYLGARFRYGPTLPWVLDGFTLAVQPGETVALVGPSGSGKTTLVSLLPRFWEVEHGKVTLDGNDVRSLRLADLRGAIGVVPQEPALFSGTVRENIAYGRVGATDAEVEAAAQGANAAEFIDQLPDGYDTLVGERGIKLSGGQRQRIAIARAILKDPAVLILDEATSSLDTENERLIEQALTRLMTDRTTLIIAHRLTTVRRADRIVVLEKGKIVEQGDHQTLMEREGLYAKLYRHQFRDGDLAAVQ
jgi:subfamily B ATP-binding cassette protein MsbA